jgi:uncharacterized protein (TIGR03083 family)
MTSTNSPVLAIPAYIGRLREEGELLAAAAAPLSLDLPVPPCPGWQLRDLLRHVGYVHRWATGYVTERHAEMVPRLDETGVLAQDIPDPALLDWFRTGHAGLVSALETAAPDLACWTFLPGAASPRAFWARRQVHETTMHRIDVQLAAAAGIAGAAVAGIAGVAEAGAAAGAGRPVDPVPAALAADGIDELLMGFARRGARHGPLSDPPRGLFIDADTGGGPGTERRAGDSGGASPPASTAYRWSVRMGPERAEVDRGWDGPAAGPEDCTVSGPAPELYLMLWNRGGLAGLEVTGDPGVLELWRGGVQVTWR